MREENSCTAVKKNIGPMKTKRIALAQIIVEPETKTCMGSISISMIYYFKVSKIQLRNRVSSSSFELG